MAPVTVYVSRSGMSWFQGEGLETLDSNDDVYGWSSVFLETVAIPADGGHLEFYDHPVNVAHLAAHLDKMSDISFGNVLGD